MWLEFCENPGGTGIKHLCSRHFTDDSYQLAFRLLGRDRKLWKLDTKAVPTLFPPCLETPAGERSGNDVETVNMEGLQEEIPDEIVEIECQLEEAL